MERYEELQGRIVRLETDVAALKEASAPASAPAPPQRDFIVAIDGDKATVWFKSEGALLCLNPNFPRVAYGRDGHVLRRFGTPRGWDFIIPDEMLFTS